MNIRPYILAINFILLCITVSYAQTYNRLSTVTFKAGERIPCSHIVDVIESEEAEAWQQRGNPGILTLYGSTANTDSSSHSWSTDPGAFSWAAVYHKGAELTRLSPNSWSIPARLHVEEFALIHTKAEPGVWFEITSDRAIPVYHSANLHVAPDTTVELLFELTSHSKEKLAVYNQRKYEIVITPRDLYLNTTVEPVDVQFNARFPGEFDDSLPEVTNIFDGIHTIQGLSAFFLVSNIQRELGVEEPQLLQVTSVKNPDITGWSNYYEVLPHAPKPFKLIGPEPKYSVDLVGYSTPFTFEWEPADDPVQNIVYSRSPHDPHFDEVKYTVVFTDNVSMTNSFSILATGSGTMNHLNTTHGQINELLLRFKTHHILLWYVTATDGVYTTNNLPTGPLNHEQYHILYVNAPVSVEQIGTSPKQTPLHQNFPNPFAGNAGSPVTNIRFETTAYGPVTLKVYDMLGHEVAVLADEVLRPGVYTADFNGAGLPAGVYHYTLVAEGIVLTKSMVVGK